MIWMSLIRTETGAPNHELYTNTAILTFMYVLSIVLVLKLANQRRWLLAVLVFLAGNLVAFFLAAHVVVLLGKL